MSGEDLHQRYVAATALANEASALALSYFQDRARMGTKMKGFQDFVTEADRVVEDLLRRALPRRSPLMVSSAKREAVRATTTFGLSIRLMELPTSRAASHTGLYLSLSCGRGCRKSASSRYQHLTSCIPRGGDLARPATVCRSG